MLSYLKKIFISQKQVYLILLTILTILASLEFVSFALYSCFQGSAISTDDMIIRSIPALTIFVSFFLTLLINNYFIENKNEEFSIILLSGCNTKQVLIYIFIQFSILFIFADVLGAQIGYLLINLINHFTNNIYTFNYDYSIILNVYLAVLVTRLIYIYVLNVGKFIRIKLDIADFISHHSSDTAKANYFSGKDLDHINDRRGFPFGKFIIGFASILFMYIGISEMITTSSNNNLPIYFIVSLTGELLFINTTLPLIFDLLHNKVLMKKPRLMMMLANTIHLSRVLTSMINILSIVVPICLSTLYIQNNLAEFNIVNVICFYILLIIVLLSFVIRFNLYLPSITNNIATMKSLGFSLRDLKLINIGVVIMFSLFVLIIPIGLYSFILYRCYLLKYITFTLLQVLIISYLIIYGFLSIYMLIKYQGITKEVYYDIKYLNRGE